MTSMTVPLCLACSQSLSTKSLGVYFCTPCCGRFICDHCLSKNARLRRYNPCLSCLGGVGLVQSTNQDRRGGNQQQIVQHGRDNEAETFVLGDSDSDEEQDVKTAVSIQSEARAPSPPVPSKPIEEPQPPELPNQDPSHSSTYYIKSRDTLAGIALKHGVEPRQLCRFNNLPMSTLSTTPHLLHTRTVLRLPPGSRAPSPPPPDLQERLETRARERAGRAFQAVTKETDWGIAQTYVALLDVEDDSIKEGKRRMIDMDSKEGRQALAIDQYLDDNAWEEEQRKAGLSPHIEPFPYFNQKGKENAELDKETTGGERSDWWQKLWSSSSPRGRSLGLGVPVRR